MAYENEPGGIISGAMSGLFGDGAPNPHRNALARALLGILPELKNVYYNGKTVPLDGYNFQYCRFDNCTLQISSTNFKLHHCIIDPSCQIQYGQSLVKVVQLFTSRYPWLVEQVPSLAPTLHDDGTLSIGD